MTGDMTSDVTVDMTGDMITAPTPGRQRRTYAPRVPAAQRRTQLLDAALRLVVTRGHNAVTMDAVAEQVGVTKPVIYGQFASRGELLAALLRREQEAALLQLRAVLPDSAGQRLAEVPGELLSQVLAEFLEAVRDAPDRWRCIVMPMPDMPIQFHTAREQARTMVLARAETIAHLVLDSLGGPAGLDPEIVAHTLVALFEMAARLVLTDPEHFNPDRFATAIRAAIGLTRPV
jgi:AcrR family transcriptional regulator